MLETHLAAVAKAIAEPGNQPEKAFDALCQMAQKVVGAKLFTIMDNNPAEQLVSRLYSNMPDAYPVSGTKPAGETTPWFDTVINQKKTFTTNTYEGIVRVFDDHELIRSLGCAAVINVPIVIDGAVLGTLNLLHEEGFYTEDKVKASDILKLPGAACMLLSKTVGKGSK